MGYVNNITELIGKTPMVKLNRLAKGLPGNVFVKMESFNPTSSVKDRIGFNMVKQAEAQGLIKPGNTLVEATSGNTGIALAFIGAARGYKVVLTMPDTMSIERRKLLSSLGAELILTPGANGMRGAVNAAQEYRDSHPEAYMLKQFENEANPLAHAETTGPEIWDDLAGAVDTFVSGVGTGGTITGVGQFLKSQKSAIQLVAVEPKGSPVLSGGQPGRHKIQGIGAGFIPKIMEAHQVDQIITVSDDEAGATSRRLAKEEGILCGISAGANVAAALQLAADQSNAGKNIVTLICDTGERYLSTWLFQEP
jgi:cysteine synthase A